MDRVCSTALHLRDNAGWSFCGKPKSVYRTSRRDLNRLRYGVRFNLQRRKIGPLAGIRRIGHVSLVCGELSWHRSNLATEPLAFPD